MKSQVLKFITISLATSVLLAPTQEAFANRIKSQTNTKEAQILVNEIEINRSNQGQLIESGEANISGKFQLVAATNQNTEATQTNSVSKTSEVSNTVGGLFVTFVFIAYILAGLKYRKHRVHRTVLLVQQIEMLERIWKMKPQQDR
ncbi:MAG: hypothetical protein U7123_08845 [Potamolinea sp.]